MSEASDVSGGEEEKVTVVFLFMYSSQTVFMDLA